MLKALDHLEEWLIASFMATATVVVFIAVIHRYLSGMAIPGLQDFLLGINFSWAQELCIYLFIWMAKFGAAYGVRTGIHVGVDVLINRLSGPNRGRLIVFGLLAGALFTGTVGALGAKFVWENGAHYSFLNLIGAPTGDIPEGPTTPDLEWPTWIVYCAVPFGSSLMCFRFLQVTWSFLKTGALPTHEHAHIEGLEKETEEIKLALDADGYSLDDNLHAHDLKHPPIGDDDGKEEGK